VTSIFKLGIYLAIFMLIYEKKYKNQIVGTWLNCPWPMFATGFYKENTFILIIILLIYFINLQISHFNNEYGTFVLLSAVNASKGDTSGTICGSDSKSNGVGDVMNLIYEISEDISSQLHMGVMKASRRVMLDGIIGDIIAEFVAAKKCKKQKLESADRAYETCMLDNKMVMFNCFTIFENLKFCSVCQVVKYFL
jgi:hypothetical protein